MPDGSSILIVAGEASADSHGAQLVKALRTDRPGVELWGIGGAAMRGAGFEAIVDAEKISIAGLTEVLFALPRLYLILRRTARAAARRRPAVAVLIDLPDFNLRLARKLKRLGIPVVYYVSPQIWAWRRSRVATIRRLVDKMLCILPFEPTFYSRHGVDAEFIGHPLAAELRNPPARSAARKHLGIDPARGPVIALLPGSRKKEVTRHLPVMLSAVTLLRERFPRMCAVVPIATTIPKTVIDGIVARTDVEVTLAPGESTESLAAADAAVVCSGTATLQAALLARPMVVVYRVSFLTFQILRRLIRVGNIALVNLIAGRTVVPELIQGDLTADAIAEKVTTFIEDPMTRDQMTRDLSRLGKDLDRGDTGAQVAIRVREYLADNPQPTPRRTDT